MFKKDARKRFALCGGLFGVAYLAAGNLLPGVPDFLMGLFLGLGLVFLVLGLLPEGQLKAFRKWKRRG